MPDLRAWIAYPSGHTREFSQVPPAGADTDVPEVSKDSLWQHGETGELLRLARNPGYPWMPMSEEA